MDKLKLMRPSGGKIKGKRGRGVISDSKKSLVLGAVEVISYIDKHGANAEKAGRIRLPKAERADEESLKNFLNQTVGALGVGIEVRRA